jgi:hypothetical protein
VSTVAEGPATASDGRIRRLASTAVRRINTPFRNPLALAGLALVWALVAWLRMTPATHGTIWAEDGRNFLADASEFGPVRALLIPYAGYMHLLPRSIAGVVSLLPVSWWAQAITALSCLVTGLIALVVYCVTWRLPIAPWSRLLLASVTVLVPTLVAEVVGNAANMYTFALWCAFWLFLWRPSRWASAVVGGVIALLVCGTAIQFLALVPLLVFRWTRYRIPIAAGAAVGLALQAWGYTHSVRDSKPSWPLLGTINDGFLHEVAMGSWLESAHAGALIIVALGWIATVVCLLPFIIAAALLWRAGGDRALARVLTVALLAGSYVFWSAFVALNTLAVDYANASPAALVQLAFTVRYAVFPSMLLWALLVVAIGWIRGPAEQRWWPRVRVIVAAVLLLCAAVNFVGLGTMYRARGPEWSTELRKAEAKCASEDPSASVAIPIAPMSAPWTITLSCRVVDG